ncbi:MAG: NUDIX hydrolase [Candidatus Nanohaloarchaea archaeon]
MECIACGAPIDEKVERGGREFYICENEHELPRARIEDEEIEKIEFRGDQIHVSVGVIVTSGEKVLLLERRKYPYQHTIPAGHLKRDEEPGEGAIRELREETGIEIVDESLNRMEEAEGVLADPCRRGEQYHRWFFFHKELGREAEAEVNDEASQALWVAKGELDDYDLTAPTLYLADHDYIP